MIRFLINLYILIIIADAVISYIPQLHHQQWAKVIKKMADFTLNPIRKVLPQDIPLDISPIVVIILLQIIVALW